MDTPLQPPRPMEGCPASGLVTDGSWNAIWPLGSVAWQRLRQTRFASTPRVVGCLSFERSEPRKQSDVGLELPINVVSSFPST